MSHSDFERIRDYFESHPNTNSIIADFMVNSAVTKYNDAHNIPPSVDLRQVIPPATGKYTNKNSSSGNGKSSNNKSSDTKTTPKLKTNNSNSSTNTNKSSGKGRSFGTVTHTSGGGRSFNTHSSGSGHSFGSKSSGKSTKNQSILTRAGNSIKNFFKKVFK